MKTRPEVVNRCDSRFMTGFKTEFFDEDEEVFKNFEIYMTRFKLKNWS